MNHTNDRLTANATKALTSRDRDYLAKTLAVTTEFRQLSAEWKTCITQGAVAIKSARTSVVKAIEDLTAAIDQLQDIVTRMSKLRRKLMAAIQQASPPGIMGIDAILIAQEEARLAEEAERQLKQSISDSGLDAESMYEAESDKSDDMAANDGDSSAASGSPTVWGYVPPPTLVHHAIPGTQATPVDMWAYTQHVFDQALDEIALKESILEALETIAELKDSGDDEMPTLLDQQLTNMVLLWELEPYIETVPERNEIERALGVISWQTESM
ncbi:hypothetical protein EDD21DRAFT_378981, partial [Dissophora ornata]